LADPLARERVALAELAQGHRLELRLPGVPAVDPVAPPEDVELDRLQADQRLVEVIAHRLELEHLGDLGRGRILELVEQPASVLVADRRVEADGPVEGQLAELADPDLDRKSV